MHIKSVRFMRKGMKCTFCTYVSFLQTEHGSTNDFSYILGLTESQKRNGETGLVEECVVRM